MSRSTPTNFMLKILSAIILALSPFLTRADSPTAPRKHAIAVATTNAGILLDGKLEETAWAVAPDNTGFELGLERGKRETVPESVQTHVKVVHDANSLYMGIRCNDPAMNRLRPFEAHGAWDPAMWMHDTIEVFFDPTGGRDQYYHIAVDPENAQFDEFCWTNTPYSGIWQTACHKGSNFWSVELAIPFAALWKTPASQWTTNWTFSLSRNIHTHGLATSYSPVNGGFHDPENFGSLGPITVDPARFNLTPGEPVIRLVRDTTGNLHAEMTLPVSHSGTGLFAGSLDIALLSSTGEVSAASSVLSIPAHTNSRFSVAFTVSGEGPAVVLTRIRHTNGTVETGMRNSVQLRYEPLRLSLQRPVFRNNIYSTESIDSIKGRITLDMPEEQSLGNILRVTLSGAGIEIRSTNWVVTELQHTFRIKADDLPVGTFDLKIDLLTAERDVGSEALAHYATVIRKLAPAPDVEARIDDGGNLIVNGRAVTLRGWYGGFGDDPSSTLALTLPTSCNFNWGAVRGKWCLTDLRGAYSDQDAKSDAPMSEETRERLLQRVRATQGRSDVIAYYIAEEPGGFGLTPGYLRKVYDVVAEADPYRILMMVGAWPGDTRVADAVAIQPFGVPLQGENGQRWLGRDQDAIAEMRSGVRQITSERPAGKAIWCRMPCYSLPPAQDERRRNPNLTELRWITFTAILNGVKSLLPHHAVPYETHHSHRVAMDSIFEDLGWLEAIILANHGPAVTCNHPAIDTMARTRTQPEGSEITYLIAANQSYSNASVTIQIGSLTNLPLSRLLVAREDRVLVVTNGTFTDTFAPLAVHIYTTQDVLPAFKTLDELEAEIRRPLEDGRSDGNILLDPTVQWRVGLNVLPPFLSPDPTTDSADLVDGMIDGGWAPWDDDRSQCVVWFNSPVTFSRVRLQTRTIRAADIEIMIDGEWQRIGGWDDAFTQTLEWVGDPVTTDRVRIHIRATRGNWQASIGELGFYR